MNFSNYYFEAVKKSFSIPDAIKANYKATGNLSNVENWKAKIVLGNSMMKGKKIGQYDNVGYVGIGLKSNTIVPIARSDEHHAGYDFLEHLIDSKQIPNEDYYTVYALGNNYIYDENEKEFTRSKLAFNKFLSYGGSDRPVEGANEMRKFAGFLSDVVNTPTLKDLKAGIGAKGKLAPQGQRLIKALEEMAKILAVLETNERSDRPRPMTDEIEKLNSMTLDFIDKFKFPIIHSNFKMPIDQAEKEILTAGESYQAVKDIIFGYNGIKNSFHMALRNANPKDTWAYSDLEKLFGDVDLAKKEFDKISQI